MSGLNAGKVQSVQAVQNVRFDVEATGDCGHARRAAIQNPKSKIENLKRRLVEGLRVITGEGVLSGSGHLSARIPGSETFL
ncbi:MAG TPA: hypothetical protein VFD75_19810, partial [Pyrinomonadaceae bacterium]|nr:hypothetical protein [Pyrinomonadaceae bacterium]